MKPIPLSEFPVKLRGQLENAQQMGGGSTARDYLRMVARTVAHAQIHDGLTTNGLFSKCNRSFVFKAVSQDGLSKVLKIPVDSESAQIESPALIAWAPDAPGTTPVRTVADGRSYYVMDRLIVLPSCRDIAVVWALAGRLHTASIGTIYKSLEDQMSMRIEWAQRKAATGHSWSQIWNLSVAAKIVEALLRTQDSTALLHGDFRPQNILTTSDGLKVIDPMPALGDPLHDIGFWLATTRVRQKSFDEAVELAGNSAGRLAAWTWALFVLEKAPVELTRTHKKARLMAFDWMGRSQLLPGSHPEESQ